MEMTLMLGLVRNEEEHRSENASNTTLGQRVSGSREHTMRLRGALGCDV